MKLRETANAGNDRSSSSQSPKTSRQTKRNQDDPARPKYLQKAAQRQMKVVDITKCFEPGQTSSKKPNTLALKDNNNTVYQT